jgi:hypothetical protein
VVASKVMVAFGRCVLIPLMNASAGLRPGVQLRISRG